MRCEVDFSKTDGAIKPLHGVNNGPKGLNFSVDNSRYFIDAAIPHCRLHDTEYPYGSGVFVDIHCVFPNFDSDPDDPKSYHFYHTDAYIKSIIEVGADVVYRLGESIDHSEKKTFVFPPKDYEKWARICAGIVRHYNCGWADGFHYNIEYWEIWNEPDNSPVIETNPMWQGTEEQYYELYGITARLLKSEFPDIKVGGYASCGFYAILNQNKVRAAGNSGRTEHFLDFFDGFMKYITAPETKAPIDFFSWHSYADSVETNIAFTRYAREQLDGYGLTGCESSLNEWNIRPCRLDIPFESAAAVCANLCALAYEPLDSAQYYDAQVLNGDYCGIFDARSVAALPPYYALKAYGQLYRLGSRCHVSGASAPAYLCAARDGEVGKLLAVNLSDKPLCIEIAVSGAGEITDCRSVDRSHSLESKEDVASRSTDGVLLRLDEFEMALIDLELTA